MERAQRRHKFAQNTFAYINQNQNMGKNAVEVLMMSDLSRAALSGLVTACKREQAHDNAAVNGNANADQNYPKIRPRRAQAMSERNQWRKKGGT